MNSVADPGLLFAEKFLALLDSGRYTATHKFGVLIALLDEFVESVDPPKSTRSSRNSGGANLLNVVPVAQPRSSLPS